MWEPKQWLGAAGVGGGKGGGGRKGHTNLQHARTEAHLEREACSEGRQEMESLVPAAVWPTERLMQTGWCQPG